MCIRDRFTGWTDVDLTEKGTEEAIKAGNLLKEKGFVFEKAYTSYLKRAITVSYTHLSLSGPSSKINTRLSM